MKYISSESLRAVARALESSLPSHSTNSPTKSKPCLIQQNPTENALLSGGTLDSTATSPDLMKTKLPFFGLIFVNFLPFETEIEWCMVQA